MSWQREEVAEHLVAVNYSPNTCQLPALRAASLAVLVLKGCARLGLHDGPHGGLLLGPGQALLQVLQAIEDRRDARERRTAAACASDAGGCCSERRGRPCLWNNAVIGSGEPHVWAQRCVLDVRLFAV